ncbi:MAG: glycine--tRNA ligase subunit beta, partial [Gammaproteobacteria bacterium]
MDKNRDLLFELGTEELPPKSLRQLSDALQANFTALLERHQLAFESIQAYASPRRLAFVVSGLAACQPDTVRERRGPALSAAFDQQGLPTKAAQGFARSCGVTVEQLERQA